MEEQRASRQLTPERLAQWEGPKLAKHLRRDMQQQVALLYEKAMILRLIDPDFEKGLERIGALEFLDRYTELLNQQRKEGRERLERLRLASEQQERGG